jgi:hypothetical protein
LSKGYTIDFKRSFTQKTGALQRSVDEFKNVAFILSRYLALITHAQEEFSDVLELKIGPVAEIVPQPFGWSFELPIQLHNNAKTALYIPNPLDSFMYYPYTFLFVSANKEILIDTKMPRMPFLWQGSWTILHPDEPLRFSKPIKIIVDQDVIEEYLDDILLIVYDTLFTEGTFSMKLVYLEPFPGFEEGWIHIQQKLGNDADASLFWHGEIESNHLEIKFLEISE